MIWELRITLMKISVWLEPVSYTHLDVYKRQARNNVKRWHMIDDFADPEFFPGKLKMMEKKRPQNFLLTGMSDLSGWKPEWRDEVFVKTVSYTHLFGLFHPVASVSTRFHCRRFLAPIFWIPFSSNTGIRDVYKRQRIGLSRWCQSLVTGRFRGRITTYAEVKNQWRKETWALFQWSNF